MRRTRLNDGWSVRPRLNPFAEMGSGGSEWEPVTVPHDAMIGGERSPGSPAANGYFVGGTWEYRRPLDVPGAAARLDDDPRARGRLPRCGRAGERHDRRPRAPTATRTSTCRSTTSCGSGPRTRSASRSGPGRTPAGTRAAGSTGTAGCSKADRSTSCPTASTCGRLRSTTEAPSSRSPPSCATGRRRPSIATCEIELLDGDGQTVGTDRGAGDDVPGRERDGSPAAVRRRPPALGARRPLPVRVPGHGADRRRRRRGVHDLRHPHPGARPACAGSASTASRCCCAARASTTTTARSGRRPSIGPRSAASSSSRRPASTPSAAPTTR